MFSDILLTVDFDRTMTAPDSTIPERNMEAIRYFMDNGGSFTLNTGRSVNTMGMLLHTIPVNAPFLLYNGSAFCDNGQLTNVAEIDLPVWETLAQIHEKFPDINLEVQGPQVHYVYDPQPDYIAYYEGMGWKWEEAVPGMELGPFMKLALFGQTRKATVDHMFTGSAAEFARFDEIEQWLNKTYGDKICTFRAAPRIVDVHARGVSKGVAARKLQHQLGKKYLVCVGDAENDLAMLKEADFSYTPADGLLADRFENVCECAKGAVADVIYEKIPKILQIQP